MTQLLQLKFKHDMSLHILQSFGVAPDALLGKGSESQVYTLDEQRVVRLYSAGASLAYIEARRTFYNQLAARNPPFEIPTVLDNGVIDSQPYTIEQRMRGRDFAQVLPRLTGRDRKRALESYLDVATQIGTIQFPDAAFGEIIRTDDALQRDSWPQFLLDRVQQTLTLSHTDLAEDVPELDHVLAEFYTRVPDVLMEQTKSLVHGDYFPGNVFIDDTLTVCGVGDFGYSTVIGDPRMDIAGAIVFLEVVGGYQVSDTHTLLEYLRMGLHRRSADVIDLYRVYYSLYFSHCKQSDPRTYTWCVENLRASTRITP